MSWSGCRRWGSAGESLLILALVLSLPTPISAQGARFLNKSAAAWIRELDHNRASVRRGAAFALGRLGEAAIIAVPDLERCLKEDQDPRVREAAATALGEIVQALGAGGEGLWPGAGVQLQKTLAQESDARVRSSAAFAVGCFGTAAAPARETLIKALKDTDASVRQNAAFALGRLGQEAGAEAVRGLTLLLKDDTALVRRDAATALGTIGLPLAQPAVRPLLDVVRRESDDVVLKTALEQLVDLVGPEERGAAKDLAVLLRRPDAETNRLAAFVLARIGGPESAGALPILQQALRDQDPTVPALAAMALAGLGTAASPALPDLVRLLTESKDPVARRNVVIALGAMKERAGPALLPLAEALRPGNPGDVRIYAADALAQIGYPLNARALPIVLEVLRKDADALVRHRCVWVLFKVEDLEKVGAVAPLAASLDEKSEETIIVRYEAARVLAFRLGEKAPDRTVEVLMHMLSDRTLKVHQGTDAKVSGVGSETGGGQSAVQEKFAGDGRYMAAEALGWLGQKAASRPEVVKALSQAVKDADAKLREKAEQALERLRRGDSPRTE